MEKFRKLVELEVAKEKVTPKVALPVLSEELPIDEETLRYIMAGPALAMKARIGSLEFNPMNILYELGDTILKWRGE